MSKTKSLTDLVNGMKGGETTANWDVVVSYSVDQLNSLLQGLWVSYQASTKLTPLTPYVDLLTSVSHTLEWEIYLTTQTLSFTSDGQARLRMTISGQYRVQGTDAGGQSYPWEQVPSGCTFVAQVPLQSVRAKEGDSQGTDATPGHQIITFGNDPFTKLHIVFNFDNDQTSNYAIDCPAQYQLMFEPLAGQLRLWMQNPQNISTIQYSLAIIAPTETVGSLYLTPLSVGFTVYTDENNACLSVYIQTRDSGNNPGNGVRTFNLPNSNGTDALPVPTGHSASIIIRRQLFLDKFLLGPLKSVKTNDRLVFKSVTAKDTTSGFSLDLRLDGHVTGDFSDPKSGYFGLKTDPFNWDLSSNPFSLSIDDGKVTFGFAGEYKLKWKEVVSVGGILSPWGIVNWTPFLFKSVPMTTDRGQIMVLVEVNQGDWKPSQSAEASDGWKMSRIPTEVEDGLKKIQLPTFSQSLRLDYFITTNVFAPGRHIIDIDTVGVFTPFDVLLVGDVASSVWQPR